MSTSGAYHHGDLKAALLQTAGELMEKEGLASLSLRELARRAGVSHNAPYRHFPDRERLLVALAAEGFHWLSEALARRPQREMGEAYVDFALAHPQRFRLMFGGLLRLEAYPELSAPSRRAFELLQEAFADLGAHAPHAAAAAWGLVHGLAHLLLDGHFPGREARAWVHEVLGTVRFAAPRKSG